jgi:hypothetical protein
MTYNHTTNAIASNVQRSRRSAITGLTLVTALLSAMSISGARAAYSLDDINSDDFAWTKRLDLGIDVSEVAKTPQGIRTYIAQLPPITQYVIMTTCEHYMEFPAGLKSADTYAFCRIAVEG